MSLSTDYEHNIERKTAKIIFRDDGNELSYFEFKNNLMTLGQQDGFSVVPKWGTNKDIKAWHDFLITIDHKIDITDGVVRVGHESKLEITEDGIEGKVEFDGLVVGDWEWTASTGVLELGARAETAITFAEFKIYVQWMLYFQYAVENYGG